MPSSFRLLRAAALTAIVAAAPMALAAEPPATGSPVSVTLASGETLQATLIAQSDETVILDHRLMGRLTIPASSITAMTAAEAPAEDAEAAAAAAEADDVIEAAGDPSFWRGWSGQFDFGLFGSEGNTRRLNLRAGLALRREAPDMLTVFDTRYYYATDGSERTDNKARADFRNDWLLAESRWRPFVLGTFEYDEFQDWDFRVGAYGGIGYEFIKTDTTLLVGRVGAGASREIGGSDNAVRPEGLIGADFEHQINDRQKFTATVDVFPDLKDFGEFRANAKAAWEVVLDSDSKITLKIGVENRYDSTPGDARRNDLDYFAVIVIPF